MMAEMPGPTFWHLDGSNMDDDFAFDIYHRTREEWEEEQRDWEELRQAFRRGTVRTQASRGDGLHVPARTVPSAIWSRSFSVGDTADVPLGVRVFGVGCQLAELIVGLRGGADREATAPEAQRHIDQLNRDFGNLRELLQSADSSLAEALIDPVLRRFAETLDTVATAHPDLASQCESLTNDLDKLLDPPPPEPTWDSLDPELPF